MPLRFLIYGSTEKCLDIGCSTGGFTDCLLQNGAASVTSVDVGYAQFDWSLRNKRVELLERTNITSLPNGLLFTFLVLLCVTLSFTSIFNSSFCFRCSGSGKTFVHWSQTTV